jgi:hypothetical protein
LKIEVKMADASPVEHLTLALDSGQSMFSIHYGSESFVDAQVAPTAISSIAVYNLKENVTITFGRLDSPEPETAELKLLDRFYGFLSDNRDAIFLHWNMGSAQFGFEAIAKRYAFLVGSDPVVISPQSRTDVDKLIRARFGEDYAPHGRLQSIAKLNDLDLRGFLPGGDEANAFKSASWGDLARSSATKAQLIADLLRLLVSGALRTNNSAGKFEFANERLDAVSTVIAIGERFRLVQRSLGKRERDRPSVEFNDEYDDQYLMRALLGLFFDDIRPEDYVPEYAGGRSRVDFLLPDHRLAVELKHTRSGLSDRNLGEELVIDSARYRNANSANHLIALVFDHDGVLNNPRGLERDLQREIGKADLAVTVRIFDR